MHHASRHLMKLIVILSLNMSLFTTGSASHTTKTSQGGSLSPLQQQQDDRGKMAGYRALAKLAYESFQRADFPTAARLADALETFWNQYEEPRMEKASPDKFRTVDDAMDAFIKPLVTYEKKTPDSASVRAAFENYVQKLKLMD
jgi:hypothetical protein